MSAKARLLLWAPVALLVAFEFYLSSQSHLPRPPISFDQIDKLEHAAYFFLMASFAVRAARFGEGWSTSRTVWAVLIGAMLLGTVDEFHQSFVPLRSVEIADIAADTAGGLVAALLAEKVWVRLGLDRTIR